MFKNRKAFEQNIISASDNIFDADLQKAIEITKALLIYMKFKNTAGVSDFRKITKIAHGTTRRYLQIAEEYFRTAKS